MVDIKVSLCILVPGATMYSSQLCDENSKEKFGEDHNPNDYLESCSTFVDRRTKEGKRVRERVDFKVRKRIPAKQVINLSQEAYRDMTGGSAPYWYRDPEGKHPQNSWQKLSKPERLQLHLHRLAANFQGKLESYQVLPD